MTITKTWNITNLKTKSINDFQDVIVEISWEFIGVDETGENATLKDTINLLNPDLSNFVPFESLTKEQVIEWVKNFEDVSKLEIGLENRMIRNKNKSQNQVIDKFPSSWT